MLKIIELIGELLCVLDEYLRQLLAVRVI